MASIFEFIGSNFWHVAPILLAGALGLAITIERGIVLLLEYPIAKMPQFIDKLRDLIMTDRLTDALALCEQYRSKPAANVIKEALLRAHQPEDMIEEGLHISVAEASYKIQLRTNYLATIANVSTLLGLFGTIVGMIHAFEAVGSANPQQRSALLAAGISMAMNATMMGLAVAIPCMVAYSILISKSNFLNSQVEDAAARIIDLIKQRFYEAENEPFKEANPSGSSQK